MLKDFQIAPLSGKAPTSAVIFLHGYGDRGDGGLLDLGRLWQKAMPDCEFLCPDALSPFEMNNDEYQGRQWFSLRRLSPGDMHAGVMEAAPELNAYIDHVLDTRHLKPQRLALVGFSQGTMMALYVGLRRPEALAAIIGYSGLLVAPEQLASEKRSSPPVLLMHGTADDVVPYASLKQAVDGLRAANIEVRSVSARGVGHTIDDSGLQQGLQFLLENLPSNPI